MPEAVRVTINTGVHTPATGATDVLYIFKCLAVAVLFVTTNDFNVDVLQLIRVSFTVTAPATEINR